MTTHDVSTRRHCLRLVTANDLYAFQAVDGHGGWPRVSTLMQRIRKEAEVSHTAGCGNGNNTDSPATTVITTVNGDVMGGSSLLIQSKGRLAIDVMNAIPVDFAVLGNVGASCLWSLF